VVDVPHRARGFCFDKLGIRATLVVIRSCDSLLEGIMGDERHVGEFVADHGLFDEWFAVYDAFAGMSDCVFEADS